MRNDILKNFAKIVEVLKSGEIVAMKSDTIYGIFCLAQNQKSVENLHVLRGRNSAQGFIILADSVKTVEKIVNLKPEIRARLNQIWNLKNDEKSRGGATENRENFDESDCHSERSEESQKNLKRDSSKLKIFQNDKFFAREESYKNSEKNRENNSPTSVILSAKNTKFPWLADTRNEKFTICFRVPSDEILRKLLRKTGPLCAPSANPADEIPAENIKKAREYFGEKIAFYVDGGEVSREISASRIIEFAKNGEVKTVRGDGKIHAEDFVISRRRKLYKFAKFLDAKNCFDEEKWRKNRAKILRKNQKIVAEIGAGSAVFLTKMAAQNPDKIFVAVDRKSDRLWQGAKLSREKNLKNIFYVWAEANNLNRVFPPEILSEIWLTFPDPFARENYQNFRGEMAKFYHQNLRFSDDENYEKNREIYLKKLREFSEKSFKNFSEFLSADSRKRLTNSRFLKIYEKILRGENCEKFGEKIDEKVDENSREKISEISRNYAEKFVEKSEKVLRENIENLSENFVEKVDKNFDKNFEKNCEKLIKNFAKNSGKNDTKIDTKNDENSRAKIINFKTDNAPLFAFSLAEFSKNGWKIEFVSRDLHNEKIEKISLKNFAQNDENFAQKLEKNCEKSVKNFVKNDEKIREKIDEISRENLPKNLPKIPQKIRENSAENFLKNAQIMTTYEEKFARENWPIFCARFSKK